MNKRDPDDWSGAGPSDWTSPDELTEEQLTELLTTLRVNLPPGTVDSMLQFQTGPFPEGVLDADTLKALGAPPPEEIRHSHEELRRLLGSPPAGTARPLNESGVDVEPDPERWGFRDYRFPIEAGRDWPGRRRSS